MQFKTFWDHAQCCRREEYSTVNGKFDGRYREWYKNGKLRIDCTYKNDKLIGQYNEWFNDGTPSACVTYSEDGTLNGPYKIWYKGGNYHINATYRDGKLDGCCEMYDEKGNPITKTTYSNGQYTGLYEYWHNGRKFSEYSYEDGVYNGLCKCWNYDGILITECTYLKGVLHGLYRQRNSDGSLSFECNYVKGKPDGKYKIWPSNDIYRTHKIPDLMDISTKEITAPIIINYIDGKFDRIISLLDTEDRECALPSDEEITVWKACRSNGHDVTVMLRVPREAKRVTPILDNDCYKSRVEYAFVEKIVDKSGKEYDQAQPFVFASSRKNVAPLSTNIIYQVGEKVIPDRFDPNPMVGCGAGINVHRYQDHCNVWFSDI
jgi:antitoxin component YwqK of YwqJK toxin-antitoxin module